MVGSPLSVSKATTVRPWCDVTGETFDGWYSSKGNKITTDKSQRKHVESIGTRHFLEIKNVEPATDGGIYTCKGSINSDTLELKAGCKLVFLLNNYVRTSRSRL